MIYSNGQRGYTSIKSNRTGRQSGSPARPRTMNLMAFGRDKRGRVGSGRDPGVKVHNEKPQKGIGKGMTVEEAMRRLLH
jgi:hypothetical protein